MALDSSPISRNLRMNVRFLGLEVEDLIVIAFTAIGLMLIGQLLFSRLTILGIPMNWFLFLLVIAVGVPGLSAFKYGKPRGYMGDFIQGHIKPRSRCASTHDSVLTGPYIKDPGDVPEKKGQRG
jgi:hypothetical protein